jgi:hypothetical protein
MLTLPLPDGFSHGDLLADALGTEVYVSGDELVFPELDDRSRARVETAIAAHRPPAPSPPVAPLAERFEAFLSAVEGAASLASIKAAAAAARRR